MSKVIFTAIVEPGIAEQHILALKVVSDSNTMYMCQARKEPNWPKFSEAMQ
jgi:hypothetical protein